jgi:hypothetical protein
LTALIDAETESRRAAFFELGTRQQSSSTANPTRW